jgi:hypothetical protein
VFFANVICCSNYIRSGEADLIKRIVLVMMLIPLLISMSSIQASSTLDINVETDRQFYNVEQTIGVCGNLTYNDWPVQATLVALEVVDPNLDLVFARTLWTDSNGEFNTTFKLLSTARLGTYTVCVSACVGKTVTDNATFRLVMVGDVTGCDGSPDGRVDMRDIGCICNHFAPHPDDPKMELDEYRNCDINGDGVVNLLDIAMACQNFKKA